MKKLAMTAAALLMALPAWAQGSSSGGGGGGGAGGGGIGSTGGGPSSSSRAPGPGITNEAGPANRPESTPRASRAAGIDDRTGAVRPESFSRGAGPGVSGETATGSLADQTETGAVPTTRRTLPGPAAGSIGQPNPNIPRGMVPLGRQGVPEVAPDPEAPDQGAGPTGRPLDLPGGADGKVTKP